jgi:hypothetical protein
MPRGSSLAEAEKKSSIELLKIGRHRCACEPLLELFAKSCELLPQLGNIFVKARDFFFQMRDSLGAHGKSGCVCRHLRLGLEGFHVAGKEVGVARLFCAGLAGQNFDERGFALHQVLQAGLYGAEIFKMVQALGAGAEFAGRLRTAQEQDGEDGDFMAVEVEGFLETVFVLGDTAVRGADRADEGLAVQGMQRLPDGSLVEIHHRFAIRFLVASIDEGVQGEWIVFGSGDLFFNKGAQDAAFDFV